MTKTPRTWKNLKLHNLGKKKKEILRNLENYLELFMKTLNFSEFLSFSFIKNFDILKIANIIVYTLKKVYKSF